MKNFLLLPILKKISAVLVSLAVMFGISSPAVKTPINPPATEVAAGSFTPAEGVSYVISKTVLPTDNTISLSSFQTPDGRNLVMSMFGTTGYGTLDPTNTARLESISFTGITQNADGSATLTGVSRGLDFVSPYTASTTLEKTHLVGSNFILSNTSAFYGNEFALINNNQTFNGINTFLTPPILNDSNATSTSQAASRAYANSLAIQGSATSTINNSGIGILATGSQAANGTYGSLQDTHFLGTNISTSTYMGGRSNQVVVTGGSNTIDPNFIATSSNYTWSGTNIFSGMAIFSGTGTTTANKGIESNTAIAAPYLMATSTNATSTLTNLIISNNATTTNLTVSGVCMGCNAQTAFASTTASSVAQGKSVTTANTLSVAVTSHTVITYQGDIECIQGGTTGTTCSLSIGDSQGDNFFTLSNIVPAGGTGQTCDFGYSFTLYFASPTTGYYAAILSPRAGETSTTCSSPISGTGIKNNGTFTATPLNGVINPTVTFTVMNTPSVSGVFNGTVISAQP